MTRARRSTQLAASLGVLLTSGCGAKDDRPGLSLLPEMYRSVPYDSFDPNPLTRNGQTLLAPPVGTVALEAAAFAYGATPDEAQRAGRELVNPVPATPASLARGQKVFESVCFVCHGARGEGDGPIIGRFPNPPSLLAPRARGLADGQLFHIVTRGQGLMASHAAQVLPEDRWRVVLYLRRLQAPQAVNPEPAGTP